MFPLGKIRHGVLAFVLWLALPVLAPASPELRKELAEVAKSLKQFLDGRGEDAIAIGQFTGPASFPTSAGPGIAQILAEELKKVGKSVKKRAKYGVRGQYLAAEVPAEDEPTRKYIAVQLKGSIEDEFGKVIADFSFDRTLKGEKSFVDLMGASVDLRPKLTRVKRDQKLRASLADPQVDIRGNRVYASADGKFAIELLVEGKARAAKVDEGLAYVPIKRGEIYAVRLINDGDLEMAVNLSIDGLNVFEFSDLRHLQGDKKGEPLYSVWIVPPHTSNVIIKGWHRNNETSDSFQVTEYAKSAAAEIGSTANIGTITASFAAAWKEGERPPSDEPGKLMGTNQGDATGFGPPVKVKVTGVKRNIGVIRSSVSVRYSK